MLAVAGYLTTASGIRFPGAEGYPDGLAAFPALVASDDGKNILLQMAITILTLTIACRDRTGEAEFVGDYRNGFIDFGWDNFSAEQKLAKRTIELNNGRAAQMGILGLMVHEGLGVSVIPSGYLPGQV